ncbi:MAG: DegV family protein [Oscillospiraceae bacterium]
MIKIITDSTSDISREEAEKLGVTVVPLRVLFGDTAYMDGVDLGPDEFYERLSKARELPTTSQPSPEDFVPIFRAVAEKSDSAVVILISGKLSGTTQSAAIAREIVGYEDIHVIDSDTTIVGMRLLIDQALKMRGSGISAGMIAENIRDMVPRVVLFAMVDTLEYLYKGGRLSRAAKIAGTLLGFKPIITLKDGEIKLLGRARGVKNALSAMLGYMDESPAAQPGVPFYFGYTAIREKCDTFRELAGKKYDTSLFSVCPVGCTIGTHVGPGACIVAYLAKK